LRRILEGYFKILGGIDEKKPVLFLTAQKA
jgi:hypothetical protein